VDTAAEIRVHLLQKTRELMAQGFPREEAEHLAVQEMGPVAATNRALLGHAFTSKLGWVMVGLTVIASGIWISQRQPINMALTLERITDQPRSDTGPNYSGIVQDFKLVVPPSTTRVIASIWGVNGGQQGAGILHLEAKKSTPTEVKIRVGVYSGPMTNCSSGFFANIKLLDAALEQSMIGMTPNISTCIKTKKPLPSWSDNAGILYPTTPEISATQLDFNHWIPLMNFANPEPGRSSEHHENTQSNWISIAVLNGFSSPAEQPLFVTTTQKLGATKLEAIPNNFNTEWSKKIDTIKTPRIQTDRIQLEEYGIASQIEGKVAPFNIAATSNIKRLEVAGRFGTQTIFLKSVKLQHPKSRLLIGGSSSSKTCSWQKTFAIYVGNGTQPGELHFDCLRVGTRNIGTGWFQELVLEFPNDATPDQWIPIWAKVPYKASGLVNQNPAEWLLLEVKLSTSDTPSSAPGTTYENIPAFGLENGKKVEDWKGGLIAKP
jgi:hypothetical protein